MRINDTKDCLNLYFCQTVVFHRKPRGALFDIVWIVITVAWAPTTHSFCPWPTLLIFTPEFLFPCPGFEVKELQKLNHNIKKSELTEGTTIVLPAGSLSERDEEIISGIGWQYRTYPVCPVGSKSDRSTPVLVLYWWVDTLFIPSVFL